jgi:hypothetical protein
MVGALLQSPNGAKELDEADDEEFPFTFVATTVKV